MYTMQIIICAYRLGIKSFVIFHISILVTTYAAGIVFSGIGNQELLILISFLDLGFVDFIDWKLPLALILVFLYFIGSMINIHEQ